MIESIRQQIAELEEEERQLSAADMRFWKSPCHDADSEADYENRRKRIAKIHTELMHLRDVLIDVHKNPHPTKK